jgi:hypothetical protein
MYIRWIVDWDGNSDRLESSHFASHRYRTTIPARALRSKGHKVDITTIGEIRRGHVDLSADVLVVGKVSKYSPETVNTLLDAASKAPKTVADINDDHFYTPSFGEYYRKLCGLADVCTVGTEAMGNIVRRHASCPIVTVGDPVASPKREPHVYRRGFFSRQPLKIVWYGMANNITPMEKAAFSIMDNKPGVPLEFHIITKECPEVLTLCEVFSKEFGRRGSMTFHEWSQELQWDLVSQCDLVLIPSDLGDSRMSVKTANRLTDAVNAGRYVIASPIAAYKPFSDVASVTCDFPEAVKWYVNNPSKAKAKIVAGQALVEKECGDDAIGDQWLKAIA